MPTFAFAQAVPAGISHGEIIAGILVPVFLAFAAGIGVLYRSQSKVAEQVGAKIDGVKDSMVERMGAIEIQLAEHKTEERLRQDQMEKIILPQMKDISERMRDVEMGQVLVEFLKRQEERV